MVTRSSDAPRGIIEQIPALRQAADDLERQQGRGAPALRGPDGAVLAMQSAPEPQLGSPDTSTALRFSPSGVKARDSVTDEPRDFDGRHGRFAGEVTSSGWRVTRTADQYAAPVLLCAEQNVALMAYNGALYSTAPDNSAWRVMNANAFWTPTGQVSERRLKNHRGPLLDPRAVVDAIATGRFTWNAAGRAAGGDDLEHDGLYVDELAHVAPNAVVTLPDGNRAPADRALIAHLIARVQELGREVDQLRASPLRRLWRRLTVRRST